MSILNVYGFFCAHPIVKTNFVKLSYRCFCSIYLYSNVF